MKTGIDLKVSRQAAFNGLYDLSITEGQFDLVDNFDTSLQMSIYCERRADSSEVLSPDQRRGWWGNTVSNIPNFEIGSKIWILYQSRLTQDVLNQIIDYAEESLQWLVDGNYLNSFQVDAAIVDDTSIRLNITLFRSPDNVETKFFDLWNNTQSFDERSL